ncbi:MAG: hypothetical protein Q9222_002556, partial [Ikaeria aurantiellina]
MLNLSAAISFLPLILDWRPIVSNMTTQLSSAQSCADLHNSLVRRIPGPELTTRRDIVDILEAQQPALYTSLQNTQLLDFLSLSDNYDGANNDPHFTPQVLKPDPTRFLAYREYDVDSKYPEHILLYPDAESSNNGGIIYNPATNLATWAFFPPWPTADEWSPLSEILQTWLDKWETGEFHFDDEIQSLAVRSWVEKDVEDALNAWKALITAIAARLPSTGNADAEPDREPILQPQQLERAHFHPFATAFLSRAPLPPPRILWIAPGITIWTPSSFLRSVEGESPTSSRRQYIARRRFSVEEIPVLL